MRTFEAGCNDEGAPAVVMLHGMGHWTEAAWSSLAAHFAHSHRVVAFDLPGFGASDKPDVHYSLAYFTSALRAVVRATRVHEFALVGHSLGGLIAANYAAYHPGQIRALGLLDPAGFLRTPRLAARIAGSRLALTLRLRLRPPRAFVRATLRRAVYDDGVLGPDVRERAYALASDPATVRAFLRVYAGAADQWRGMRELHARFAAYGGPTTLIWGREDRYIPARGLRSARRVYPHADALVIPRCGHCPGIEYPELVAQRLLANGF